MRKKTGRLIPAIAAFLLISVVHPGKPAAAEDVSSIFCDALYDESQYDQNKFDAYKMLIPGREGWIFRSENDVRHSFSITDVALDRLSEMNDAFKARGTTLIMLLVPTRTMMHYGYLRKEDRKKYKIEDINSVWKSYWSAIRKIQDRGIHVVGVKPPEDGRFFYKRDHHWGPEGARYTAGIVASAIKSLPEYNDIPKITHITRAEGSFLFDGVSNKVFSKLCHTVQPPEAATRYVTERADTATARQALFGDAVNPDIVLLGTSNSTMIPSYANFEGFLREQLSADILNMSVSGGGIDTALLSYLNSPFFQEKPAKIAIWEIPGNYDLSKHHSLFRQALPALAGSCKEPIERAENRVITHKNLLVLENLHKKKIHGRNYYLNLLFEKPVTKSFIVDMRYQEGRDKFKFHRSSRTPNDNQFFIELADNKDSLDKVVLYLPASLINQTIDVKLCRKTSDGNVIAALGGNRELNVRERVIGLLHKIKAAIDL